MAFFGDGAVNNGAFHEGLNMAGIWKLPVLFVCENNQFATEVPFAYAAASPSVAAARRSLRHARDRGRRQRRPGRPRGGRRGGRSAPAAAAGPTLLECRTYRTRPHAEGMGDYTYRTREEVEAWKTRCPIHLLCAVAARTTAWPSAAELEAIEAEIEAAVDDAQQFAEDVALARPRHGRRGSSSPSRPRASSTSAATPPHRLERSAR